MEPTQIVHPKASPKDVFLQLASIAALYGGVIALLTLLFQIINIAIPDVAENYYYFRGYSSTARGAIAALVVFFPMFIWTVRALERGFTLDESRKKISIRKWLLHFTIFVAAFVIAGDLIVLIHNFLNGDLTLKFALKILSVFLVAISVFWYYRSEIKETGQRAVTYLGYGASLFVLASIIGGVVATGSPFEARRVKLDDQRISDLQMIQGSIIEYWQSKGKLPENLSVINDNLRGISVPKDPETKKEYGYGTKGSETFVLCAVFSTNASNIRESYYVGGFRGNETWNHDAGQYCFERTIDKDFFKPYPQPVVPVKQ